MAEKAAREGPVCIVRGGERDVSVRGVQREGAQTAASVKGSTMTNTRETAELNPNLIRIDATAKLFLEMPDIAPESVLKTLPDDMQHTLRSIGGLHISLQAMARFYLLKDRIVDMMELGRHGWLNEGFDGQAAEIADLLTEIAEGDNEHQ